jgi:hypothetical protein
MAHPTDFYVALSDAPAGIEHQFQTVQPAAFRSGAGLVMFFDCTDSDTDTVYAFAEELEAVLDGLDHFWAVLSNGQMQACEGDIEHTFAVPMPGNELLH